MKDFSDTQPTNLYETAIGKKNQTYYLDKFETFDEKGAGLHPSWNWAAFFFTGFWALYRKLYGWFLGWICIFGFLGVMNRVASKAPSGAFWLAVGNLIVVTGFAAYANSLYHSRVKARIAAAQKSGADASRVRRRLSSVAGVHLWVPIGLGVLFGLGILAAVVLPAYQDYMTKLEKRPEISQTPQKTSTFEEAQGLPSASRQVNEAPSSTHTSLLSDREVLRKNVIGGNQSLTDVAAWGDEQLSARFLNSEKFSKAHSFVLMWQRQIMQKSPLTSERSLFLGYSIVINYWDEHKLLCRPDTSKNGGVEIISDQFTKVNPECLNF